MCNVLNVERTRQKRSSRQTSEINFLCFWDYMKSAGDNFTGQNVVGVDSFLPGRRSSGKAEILLLIFFFLFRCALEEHFRHCGYKPGLLCCYENIIYLLEPNYLVARAKKVEFLKAELHHQPPAF